MIELTKAERAQLIADARAELVAKLHAELANDIQTVSRAQLAGLLDSDPRTIDALKIKGLPITGKRRYKLSTVAEWMKNNEEL